MIKIQGNYQGNLRCELAHPSTVIIQTDAPKDNQGEGKFFSPTDLVASALGSCMLTIIAIRARTKGIEIGHPQLFIEKEMQAAPRKINRVKIEIAFQEHISIEQRKYLENEAKNCPVALSLSASLEQEIIFRYA